MQVVSEEIFVFEKKFKYGYNLYTKLNFEMLK